MPSLQQLAAVKDLPGYQPADGPKPPIQTPKTGANPYRRCPLPPFSATSDTLRQFEENGPVPARRVIPLPFQTAGTGSAVTNVTNVTSTPSSGGSGGSATTLPSASVSFSVPSLTPGQSFPTSVQMAKSFRLLFITSTNPLEARIYATALAQTIDIGRPSDTAPPFETTQGLISDVIMDTSPFQWNWADRGGANADNPQTKTIYVTVVNNGISAIGGSNCTITYVSQET